LPSRSATGRAGRPDGLKALLLTDPTAIEEGLRVLDIDLMAGPAGTIDVLGLDGAGCLAILAVAEGDPDAALLRLLDQCSWAGDQRALLERLYSPNGLVVGSPIRCLLLAPSFTHAFLRRLSLVAVEVTPYLARQVFLRGERAVLVEPALEIFGLEPVRGRARVAERRGTAGAGSAIAGGASPEAMARREVAPSPDSAPLEAAPLEEVAFETASSPVSFETRPLDGDEGDGKGWPAELLQDRRRPLPADLADLVLPRTPASPPETLEEIEPAGIFESLNAEELEEFQRFDRQRRERDRRTT
jgi:hypothetical protein